VVEFDDGGAAGAGSAASVADVAGCLAGGGGADVGQDLSSSYWRAAVGGRPG
jgi:hypothetical protein